jgi:hypothetical protein
MRAGVFAAAVLLAALGAGCSSEATSDGAGPDMPGNPNNPNNIDNPGDTSFKPTPDQTLMYMRYLGPSLLGRVLSDAEETRLTAEGFAAVKPLLEAWVTEPGFADAIKSMMEMKLAASGRRGMTDYGLAGYLVRHVVANNMPWSTILTSETYYDANGAAIPNDTGAPYSAGVMTTKGFLAGNESRFNLSRAHQMLLTFMCRDYPHETDLQPPVEKTKLKVMFRAENPAEQMVAEAAGGFGNGLACYSCHSQFSLHAQPFVKFDNSGNWKADATGVQSTTGQLGESDGNTMASHWELPADAGQEGSQWFGSPINNLADGGKVVAGHQKFKECTVQHLLDLGVGLNPAFETGIKGVKADPAFLTEVAAAVTSVSPDPTIQALAIAAYSDVRVIATTINGLKR